MSVVTTSECPGTRGRAVGPRQPRVRCRGLRCVPDELCAVAIPRGIALGVVFTSTRDLRRRPRVRQRMRVPGLGPFPKREYRFDGAPADLRQGVLHVKRNLRDHLSVHEPVVLQPAQRSGQYLRRDALKAPLQRPEAQRSLGQCADGQRGPLVGHDVKKIAARALRGVHVSAVPLRTGCRRMAAAQGSTSRRWIRRMRLRTSQEIVLVEGGRSPAQLQVPRQYWMGQGASSQERTPRSAAQRSGR